MDDKKKFVIPEAESINFVDNDIVTVSANDGSAGWDGEEYTEE